MLVAHRLGAAPRSIYETGPVTTAKSGRFTDHPLIAVGPWTFSPKGSRIEIADGRLPASGPHMQFLFQGVYNVTRKANCATNMMCMSTNYKGWKASEFNIVPAKFYDPVVKGDAPIYKVSNPLEGGNWGVFVTRKDHSVVVEFKRIPQDWWQRVGGWVANVVGVVIDTIKALFDFFKNLISCATAGPILDAVAGYATGSYVLQAGSLITTQIKKAGVTDQELARLETNATSALATSIGNKIVSAYCPSDSVPPPLSTETGQWYKNPVVWGTAGVLAVGAGLAVYLTQR